MEVARIDAEDAWVGGGRFDDIHDAANHLGIHPRATDILAYLLDDEQMDEVKRQACRQLLRQRLQLQLCGLELGRAYGPNDRRLIVAVFDDAESKGNARMLQHRAAHGADDVLIAILHISPMVMLGAMIFAETDGHHLEQAALDGAAEIGMRLHAVDDADVIRLGGIFIEPHRQAVSATVCPGLMIDATSTRANSACTAAGILATASPSNVCRMRYMLGYIIAS